MKVIIYTDGSARSESRDAVATAPSLKYHRTPPARPSPPSFRVLRQDHQQPHGAHGGHRALEALNRPCEVEVHSDSQYVVNAFNKHWIDGWKKRGWKTANKQPVKNRDLWERLLAAKSKHKVEFIWVKGHAGHELNERCDELATTVADGVNLDIDTGFNESDL